MTPRTDNLGFYASGTVLLLVCALKTPALIRRRHDTLLRAAWTVLFAAGSQMLLAAPDSIVRLDRLTGISNIAAPVVYATTVLFSGASLLLIINWRPAPADQTRRLSRWCVTTYGVTIVAVIILFWAGNTPVQQVTAFDAYYASTPYIREMIVTYLVAQSVAMMAASALCWRWSKEVHGSLRAGLRILAPTYLIVVSYDVIRLVGVVARWTHHNLDVLIVTVSPPLAAPASLLGAIGFTLPLAGPRLTQTARSVRQLRELAPLWRALEHVPTPGAVRTSLSWWRTPPAVFLTGRRTALYDAIRALAPYYDPAVREAAYHTALSDGADEASAAVTADAAMVLAARDRQRTVPEQPYEPALAPAWQAGDLVLLSRALSSPRIRELSAHDVPEQKAAHHE
ncbi:MAB_1171c family putative transporter [Streptomyces hokutonensis]|uniref:MAB_1171c family putative transporter n=1 Tax=Streptomyces hokutonensis TaxID=1306990 RepID=UPI00382EF6B5